MTRRLAILAIFVAAPGLAQTPAQATVTGYITDTMCGKRGANALHIDHAKRAVASGKAQYAVYDEATKRLYILESQAQAAQYLGQRVRITGTLSASPVRSAGESYAPDAVATVTTRGAVSATSGEPLPSATPRVQQHAKALDTSTPVAGVLSATSIEIVPR